MLKFLLRRLGVAVLVALTVSMITFSLIYLSGDPAIALAGESASNEEIENIREVYGYDRPIIVQYGDWLVRAMQGDLGRSHYLKSDISAVIVTRLPNTLILALCAISFALVLSIPLGEAAAIRPNSLIDRFALGLAVVGQALPSFWFALILIFFMSIQWRLLPITGTDSWKNFIMPAVALGYYVTPGVMRLTRAGMLEVLQSDYIRTA
ncbi:MAG: ABC transporter permease, partial [Rhodospirillales bacterium]